MRRVRVHTKHAAAAAGPPSPPAAFHWTFTRSPVEYDNVKFYYVLFCRCGAALGCPDMAAAVRERLAELGSPLTGAGQR